MCSLTTRINGRVHSRRLFPGFPGHIRGCHLSLFVVSGDQKAHVDRVHPHLAKRHHTHHVLIAVKDMGTSPYRVLSRALVLPRAQEAGSLDSATGLPLCFSALSAHYLFGSTGLKTLNPRDTPLAPSHIKPSPGLNCTPSQPFRLGCWSWEAGEKALSPRVQPAAS